MSSLHRRMSGEQLTAEMPLQQYFLFVGGALLILLFIAGLLTPLQTPYERFASSPNFPPIRIHSARRGPDAVVIDTSKSTLGPMMAAHGDMVAPEVVASAAPAAAEQNTPIFAQRNDANEQTRPKEDPASRSAEHAGKKRKPILAR
jgi:hypothetical protein